MEKVPNLDIFSQRQLKKSSSLSRINHDHSYRPSSTFQSYKNNQQGNKNYYDQAIKMLNFETQMSSHLKNISNKQASNLDKSNLKRIGKNQQNEKLNATFSNNHYQIIQNVAPQMNKTTQNITFNYASTNSHGNTHQVPINNNQNVVHFQHFHANNPQIIHQQPIISQVRPENNVAILPNQQVIMNNAVNVQLQRGGSTQNLHFRDYSQPDKILSSCRIEPACNNEEQKIRTSKNGKEYTFRNETESQQKTGFKKVTLNPFLFDATYLLQIKESESRLPDITLVTNNKQYFQEMEKKQELLEQLVEIKQTNQAEGKNLLRQLDYLIEQFDTKSVAKNNLEESEFKNSRRSLFDKIH